MTGWQWHQLNHMQIICTSLQTDNYSSTSSLHPGIANRIGENAAQLFEDLLVFQNDTAELFDAWVLWQIGPVLFITDHFIEVGPAVASDWPSVSRLSFEPSDL